ncbi:MAG: ATP-binding protein, partial [Chlamydiota bacterium]
MDLKELKQIVARGEDSHHQFKEDFTNGDQLAAEMVAFSNAEGGRIFVGVDKAGDIKGIFPKDIERLNQLISNTASQHVRSPITVHTENISTETEKIIIVLSIPKGIDKPYFDKRRINSNEELRRLFQSCDQIHADELPTKGSLDVLDKSRLKRFVEKNYNHPLPESPA